MIVCQENPWQPCAALYSFRHRIFPYFLKTRGEVPQQEDFRGTPGDLPRVLVLPLESIRISSLLRWNPLVKEATAAHVVR